MRLFILVISVAVVFAHQSLGDTLCFKSGKKYECDILGYSNDTFRVRLNGQMVQAKAVTIEKITFSDSISNDAPSVIGVTESYEFQEDAKLTPALYLADKTFSEAIGSVTPSEIDQNAFSYENKCIKLVFKTRGAIEQIGTNEFRTTVYGDSLKTGVFEYAQIYFYAPALKYMQGVNTDTYNGLNESTKTYSLYGTVVTPKTLETFQSEYVSSSPMFIPIGRTSTRAIGNKGITYSW